jgi:F-type H+-transporting ATPase subunit b
MALGAALIAAPVIVPCRAAAQQTAKPSSASSSGPSGGSTSSGIPPLTANTEKAEDNEESAFLHAPAVRSVARILHLDIETTIAILLGINFAVIFFAIAIPLYRVMPKVLRNRSRTLSQDLKTARDATADAQVRLSAVEAKLAGLDQEMRDFRAQVERESLEDERRIKAAIGEESFRIVAAAEQEIGLAAAQAKRGLRNFAADLAIEQATKQLVLTPDADRAVIAEFVSGIAADGPGKGGKN